MSTQAIQAGEAFIQLNIHGEEIQKSLTKIGSQLDEFGSKMVSSLGLIRSALGGAIDDSSQLGDAISLIGESFNFFSGIIGSCQQYSSVLQKTTASAKIFTFQQLQQSSALKLGNILTSKSIIARSTLTAVSYLHAASLKALCGVQWLLNGAMYGCPITWLVAGLAGIGAAIGGVMYLVGAFGDSTAETAKSMEELRKRNDEFRNSARESVGILEDLSRKTSLNASQQDLASKAFSALNHSCDSLGGEFTKLNVVFDKSTGKMGDISQQLLKLKEEMRLQEAKDLGQEFDALTKHLEFLKSCLNEDGEVGWRRWFGTWFFGYMDNAEEIQQKIQETQQKIQENVNQQAVVVDWSVEYKENEKKLEEIYAKEAEASRNALQVKIDGIQKEFAEREMILKQLIQEMEIREKLLSEDEKKVLNERRAALAGLNAEQERRIQLLKDEYAVQVQKTKDDYDKKIKENKENKEWRETLDFDPKLTKLNADNKYEAAYSAFANAVEAAANADETTSKEELERLNAEVEKTRKEAEKWYARREEAAAKVADIEKKAAEDAKTAAAEAAKTKEDRLKEIDQMEADRKEAEALKEEEESWKNMKEDDPSQARDHARSQVDTLSKSLKQEEKFLRQLAENGASQEEYDAQKEKISKLADSVNVWEQRLEEASVEPMDEVQEAVQTTPPDVLLAGSVDAQKKFMELQQAGKNPMEMKLDESNSLLKRLVESSENLESQMEGI